MHAYNVKSLDIVRLESYLHGRSQGLSDMNPCGWDPLNDNPLEVNPPRNQSTYIIPPLFEVRSDITVTDNHDSRNTGEYAC